MNVGKRILGVIPARYASTRFPGKPLAKVNGVEMVICVYRAVIESGLFDKVVVATDSRQIFDTVIRYGYDVMMTDENHSCGTERCNEVLSRLEQEGEEYDIVVNIQGDEPLIKKQQLDEVISSFTNEDTQIATLCKMIEDIETLSSPNCVKVIFDDRDNAIYFSRAIIPYFRGETLEYGIAKGYYYKHVGLYAFDSEILHEIVRLEPSQLEKIESLEQLRWIEQGYNIKVVKSNFDSFGVDTPEDLEYVNSQF